MSIFLSCKKNDFYDIKDVTIVIGDSGNVKIKSLDIKIETNGTYNFDVNNDGVNDFALWNVYVNDVISKSGYYYCSLKALSENSKVLCDTISLSKGSFFFAPKPLFIKDTISAAEGLWLSSTDLLEDPGPYPSRGYYYPSDGFLIYSFYDPWYPPQLPGVAKGGIPWEEFMTFKEKYIGILSEKNGIATMGWIMLTYSPMYQVTLNELGTADFPLEGHQH